MIEREDRTRPEPPQDERDRSAQPAKQAERPAKQAERPAPGVKHVPEPDAENIMPAEHEPGTL